MEQITIRVNRQTRKGVVEEHYVAIVPDHEMVQCIDSHSCPATNVVLYLGEHKCFFMKTSSEDDKLHMGRLMKAARNRDANQAGLAWAALSNPERGVMKKGALLRLKKCQSGYVLVYNWNNSVELIQLKDKSKDPREQDHYYTPEGSGHWVARETLDVALGSKKVVNVEPFKVRVVDKTITRERLEAMREEPPDVPQTQEELAHDAKMNLMPEYSEKYLAEKKLTDAANMKAMHEAAKALEDLI
jgi:hypothetical protein